MPSEHEPSTSGRTSPPSPTAMPPPKRRRTAPAAAAPPQAVTAAPAAAKAKAAPKAAAAPQQAAKDEDGMWMIVGLGNPGAGYDNTRHNIGFAIVDALAQQEGIDCRKLEKSAAVGKGVVEGKQVLLVKPVTFMNNSGDSVQALATFYRVPLSRVLVISDDLDLPLATVRLRSKGGHGGHNGLRSIIARCGNSQEFPRIKVGIGRPSGPIPVPSYVLMPFSKQERGEVEKAVDASIGAVRAVLRLGMEKALSGSRI